MSTSLVTNGIPIPQRKPTFTANESSGDARGFLDSLSSAATRATTGIAGFSEDAVGIAHNVATIKNLFSDSNAGSKNIEENPPQNNPVAFLNDSSGNVNTNIIGLALGALGLYILFARQ